MSLRLRSTVAAGLVVVTCVLAPLAVTAVWVNRAVFDTDGYVATVAPLADDAAVQHAVVTRTVETIDGVLDPGPVLRRVIEQATTRVVESAQFADLWARLNRAGHGAVKTWFSGESSRVSADVVDDQLVVSLQPLVAEVARRLDESRVPGVSGDRLQRLDPKLVLVDGELVGPIRTTLRTLDDLAWVLSALTVAGLVGAVVVAADRRRALARLGIGLVISMAAVLVALRVGRQEFVDWIATTSVSVPASTTFYETLSRDLRAALLIGMVLGVGVALGTRFAGRRDAPARDAPRSVATFAVAHARGFAVTLVLVGLAALAVVPDPTLLLAALVGAAVLAGLAALAIVRGQHRYRQDGRGQGSAR